METLVIQKILPEILVNYDIGAFIDVQTVSGGFTNENYMILTTKGKFLFKKYLRANSEKILREHHLINLLVEKKFPVPGLIASKSGDTFIEYENNYYAVQVFIEGDTPVITNKISAKEFINIAESLARYHWIAREIPIDIEPSIPIIDRQAVSKLYETVIKILSDRTIFDEFDKVIARVLPEKIQEIRNLEIPKNLLENLPALLIHGDFHAANMRFSKSGNIRAVLDWELAKKQPRIWEVLIAAIFVSKKAWTWNFHTTVDTEKFIKFINIYQKINPLLPEEIGTIPILLKMASADISWPLTEHYILKNPQFDIFLPKNHDDWFFWNKMDEKLHKKILPELHKQNRLI